MKNRKITVVVIFLLLFLFSWTLFKSISLRADNGQLREALNNQNTQTEDLKSNILTLQTKLNDIQSSPSITYCSYEFNKRLVVNQQEVYLYPGSKAPKITRIIEPYTVVDVLGSGLLETEGRELWLYVTFPVYDTPMDNRGWIRETNTAALTEENRTLVKNGVYLEKGTSIYEVDSSENIQESMPTKLLNGVSGRIDRATEVYVYIECGGGWSFWVEKKHLIYPKVD